MNDIEKIQTKIIKTIEKIVSNFEMNEGSDWTKGYQKGMLAAFDIVLEWIRKKELD